MDFVDGLFVFNPGEKAPDFVKARLSFQPEKFAKWLADNKDKANEKGFIGVDVLVSRDGKWYAKLSTFKPRAQAAAPVESQDVNPEDIPF